MVVVSALALVMFTLTLQLPDVEFELELEFELCLVIFVCHFLSVSEEDISYSFTKDFNIAPRLFLSAPAKRALILLTLNI